MLVETAKTGRTVDKDCVVLCLSSFSCFNLLLSMLSGTEMPVEARDATTGAMTVLLDMRGVDLIALLVVMLLPGRQLDNVDVMLAVETVWLKDMTCKVGMLTVTEGVWGRVEPGITTEVLD